MKMKVIVKCGIAALMVLSAAGVNGQEVPTKPVKVDGTKDYFQHGYNSGGGPFTGEERDSVTVTSQMRYFVLPDLNVSPNWYDVNKEIKSVTNTSDLNSTFTWTLKNTLGTTNSSITPIVIINWGSTAGIDSIKVKETPNTGVLACPGKETSIPVEIIRLPTVSFGAGPGATQYVDGRCYTATEVQNKITYSFPVSVSSAVLAQVNGQVSYTVTKNGNATTLGDDDVALVGGAFPIQFDDYGTYVVTITKVTDRIARKSGVANDGVVANLLTSGGSLTFTYNVMKPAETGPIYRLPNNGNY